MASSLGKDNDSYGQSHGRSVSSIQDYHELTVKKTNNNKLKLPRLDAAEDNLSAQNSKMNNWN